MKTATQLHKFLIDYPTNDAIDIACAGESFRNGAKLASYHKCIQLNRMGKTGQQIADKLGSSQSTVSRVFSRLRMLNIYNAKRQSPGPKNPSALSFTPMYYDSEVLISQAWV